MYGIRLSGILSLESLFQPNLQKLCNGISVVVYLEGHRAGERGYGLRHADAALPGRANMAGRAPRALSGAGRGHARPGDRAFRF